MEAEDWEHHKKYDEYLLAVEEMLERTESEWGPWTLVEATDRRWARVKVFETLISRLEEGLARHGYVVPEDDDTQADADEDDESEDEED